MLFVKSCFRYQALFRRYSVFAYKYFYFALIIYLGFHDYACWSCHYSFSRIVEITIVAATRALLIFRSHLGFIWGRGALGKPFC
jgi:hypothetical protein